MKTINELAESLKVSRQTIYNVINNNGISLDELTISREGKKRILKDEAEEIIKKAMSTYNKDNADNEGKNVVNMDNVYNKDALKKALKEARDARRELKEEREEKRKLAEENDKLRAEVEKLKEDNSLLIKMNATQTIMIQRQQEREQMKLATGEDTRAEGWIRRTIRRITGKGTEQKE